jgi:hypothetical protein
MSIKTGKSKTKPATKETVIGKMSDISGTEQYTGEKGKHLFFL